MNQVKIFHRQNYNISTWSLSKSYCKDTPLKPILFHLTHSEESSSNRDDITYEFLMQNLDELGFQETILEEGIIHSDT